MSYILLNQTNDAYFSSSDKKGIGPLFLSVLASKDEELLTYADLEVAHKFKNIFTAKCFMRDLVKINPKKHYLMIDLWSNLPVFEIKNSVCYRFVDGVKTI